MIKYTILLCIMLCTPVKDLVSNMDYKSQLISLIGTGISTNEKVEIIDLQSVSIEDSNIRSVVLNLIEMLLKLVIIFICILLIVITPLLLVFSVIKEFTKLKISRKKLKVNIQSLKGEVPNLLKSKELQKINLEFRAIAASLFASSFGLLSWFGLSVSYMILGFSDMSNGFRAYFYFPIKIVETLLSDGYLNLNNVYGKSWIYMLGIVMLTAVFYLVGYAIGRCYSSEKMHYYKTHDYKTKKEGLTI